MRIVMSSGHGLYVQGASHFLNEVEESRKVVERVAEELREEGHEVITFHDDTSVSQSENLDTIVDFHNSQGPHDLSASIHFNAYVPTEGPMGTEVLYLTQEPLAQAVVDAIAEAGDLVNRGVKKRTDLAFLNGCNEPAILIEVCFVDSEADVDSYKANFDDICDAIGSVGTGETPVANVKVTGKVSHFGGPDDTGVDHDEGLAFIYEYEMAPQILLAEQPPGTTGLARRLDPNSPYVAIRWDYDVTPKTMLQNPHLVAKVSAKGKSFYAWPGDWGPNSETSRVADISPGLMEMLGITTDDTVTVEYPFELPDPRKPAGHTFE
jgi:N-acetylmuramoyl-L-alanine amidase